MAYLRKLARRRGLGLNLPPVSELPAALLEDTLLDAETRRLPRQAVLDQALGPCGLELPARWRRLAGGA